MRSKWNSVPYIVSLIFMMAFITIFVTMNGHQADAATIRSSSPTGRLLSYAISNFKGTSTPHVTVTMKLYIPNAAQNPGVDISDISFYFVKPTARISNLGTTQTIDWTELTGSGTTVIAYQGTVKLVITQFIQLSFDFDPLLLTHVDFEVKEGPSEDISSQSTTLNYSFGAAPLRFPYLGNYLAPSYHLEPPNNAVQLYFPNLPHFNTNEFCIGMQFSTAFSSAFAVTKLVDERIPQDATPVLSFKSDSLRAVVCFEPDGTTATATLGSIGFTLSGIPANLNSIQFFEVPSRLVASFDFSQFDSMSARVIFEASPYSSSIQLSTIREAAQLFPSQQSATWFQWSLSYKPSYHTDEDNSLTFLPEFHYFGESQIHFCRPADQDLNNIASLEIYQGQVQISPTVQAAESQTLMTINCFGTVSPYYRHRDGIDESSKWQKDSETPFILQSQAAGSTVSNLFDFDKSTLPAVSLLPQITYKTEDYPLLVLSSALIAQHKLVVAVSGYTSATGIVFRIPNVFSVVKARGDQTSVTDDKQYVTMTYYESGVQPTQFAGKSSTETAIVPPTLKTDSVVTCTKIAATDDTTIYTCNPPATDMIDLTYTMFLSRVVDFQAILDYTQKQPSFSVFKYHPSSDYTKAVGPLKVFEVPMTIKMIDSILVSGVPQDPSETGATLQLTQQSTSDVPTSSTSALSLPTSELSIQFSAALQGPSCTAQASYYVVDGTTSTLITQQTTPETVTAAAILTSIPVANLADLTSKSVIVMMVHYINTETSLETYLFSEPFTVQSSCDDGENVCKNGVCGLDGVCQCVGNNWGGEFCNECSLECEHGAANDDCTRCDCVGPWKGDLCATCSLECEHDGTANDACTQCDCVGPWKGDLCAACSLPCEHGTANDACTQCDCVGPWKGDLCAACSLPCEHGTANDACTQCDCVGPWKGDLCTACSLPCEHNGTANDACTQCDCADNNNWGGKLCDECSLECENGDIANIECTKCDICSLKCENGGSRNTACTECECVGNWGGNFCYTCPLKCQNGGSRNAECTKCDCLTGFTGDSCESVTSDEVDDINNAMAVNFTFALSMVIVYSLFFFFH